MQERKYEANLLRKTFLCSKQPLRRLPLLYRRDYAKLQLGVLLLSNVFPNEVQNLSAVAVKRHSMIPLRFGIFRSRPNL
jgi:hypothetical protein